MKLSFRTIKYKSDDNDLKQLYIRIRDTNLKGEDEESLVSCGVDVSDSDFKNGVLQPNTPNYTSKNRQINSVLDDLQRIISISIEDGLKPNPKYVKKKYEESLIEKEDRTLKPKSFWKSYDEYLSIKKGKSRGYYKTIITFGNRLRDFESKELGRTITFDYVVNKTLIFQSEFQNYLWNTNPPHTNGYVNKLFENISGFLHFCKEMGYVERKPRFQKVSEVERDELVYLYFDEVIKLFESNKWDYENGGHKKNKPNIYVIEEPLLGTRSKEFGSVLKITNWELIKDMFLFLCSIGCRYSDIQHLKVNDFNFEKGLEHFSYIQKKTSKPVRVPINFINGEIFKKYSSGKKLNQLLFPKISIQKFNKGLQLLFEDLGFNRLLSYPRKVGSKLINEDEQPLHKLISSHCGRRTFIKNMIDKGLDYRTIMTMSGHRTIREFMKYVSVSPKDLEKGRGLYSTMNNSDETLIKQIQEQIVDLDKNKLVEVSKYINYIKSVN